MKKIAIIGPESTGKSLLTEGLAAHFQSPWVPEYARRYITDLTRPYTYKDVEHIARYQIKEAKDLTVLYKNEKPFLFFDTELIITKVWFMDVWGKCPDFLLRELEHYDVDFFLLCKPDLPWEPDPVRENGNRREYFYQWYKNEIQALNKPFAEISGTGPQRLENAIEKMNN